MLLRGDPVDHIFWGVVSIGILAVLLSLLLKMLIEDFPRASRRTVGGPNSRVEPPRHQRIHLDAGPSRASVPREPTL
jgi:hypothetical protein